MLCYLNKINHRTALSYRTVEFPPILLQQLHTKSNSYEKKYTTFFLNRTLDIIQFSLPFACQIRRAAFKYAILR
ncbi:hypothetical protein BH09BAC4_BH09BAC4_46080 [soil metagenome]